MILHHNTTMEEQEGDFIRITIDDISEANQLSLACPICANPVERIAPDPALVPVECASCGALYHKTCWEQGGGKCAMIGCDETRFRAYDNSVESTLTIASNEIQPEGRRNGSRNRSNNKQLKDQERRMQREMRNNSLFQRIFEWLLRQIRILDE